MAGFAESGRGSVMAGYCLPRPTGRRQFTTNGWRRRSEVPCAHNLGRERPMNCLACGFVMPTPLRFCGGCGARLGVDRVGETTRERNYTPAHLAKRILQTRSALEGERKHVTVLFCDIADSTPLASRIGSDRMHKLLRTCVKMNGLAVLLAGVAATCSSTRRGSRLA